MLFSRLDKSDISPVACNVHNYNTHTSLRSAPTFSYTQKCHHFINILSSISWKCETNCTSKDQLEWKFSYQSETENKLFKKKLALNLGADDRRNQQ